MRGKEEEKTLTVTIGAKLIFWQRLKGKLHINNKRWTINSQKIVMCYNLAMCNLGRLMRVWMSQEKWFMFLPQCTHSCGPLSEPAPLSMWLAQLLTKTSEMKWKIFFWFCWKGLERVIFLKGKQSPPQTRSKWAPTGIWTNCDQRVDSRLWNGKNFTVSQISGWA